MFCKLNSFFYGFILTMVIPVFAQTYDLPIVFIDTEGKCLNHNIHAKIPATIKVLDDKSNNVADSSKGIQYDIGIKVRGSISRTFPKPNYSIEFHDSTGKDINVSLFGLPPSDDWILLGPYVDKSMVRNSFGHWLFRQTGRYSPRTKHFDLYINGGYRGVYVLAERTKRGKYRVDVNKIKETDTEGENLTGGYIWTFDLAKRDKETSDETEFEFSTSGGANVTLHYPITKKLANEQKDYLKKYLNDLEALFKDGKNGNEYENYVDVASTVDFMLLQELAQNTKGYYSNLFMHKSKDKTDEQGHKTAGKITLGPPGNFYIAFNNDRNEADSNWTIEQTYKAFNNPDGGIGLRLAEWPLKIWKDSVFQIEASKRWAELRSGVWHTKVMDAYLDSMKTYLKNAADRNFKRWPNLGKVSGQFDEDPEPIKYCRTTEIPAMNPTIKIGSNADTWDGEFEHVRKTVKAKMKWMDEQLGFTEPASPVVFEPIIHEPDWRAEMGDTSKAHIEASNLSRLSPTNFFAVNGDHLEIHTSVGGSFALMDLNGAVLYKTQIKPGLTTLKIPSKARHKHWIATLNGKMMNR
ncbi:MAG: CotH kinase family protein [Fibrobacter sp.]|nr:CotH kinase family protein [Fibrobacter sp.]